MKRSIELAFAAMVVAAVASLQVCAQMPGYMAKGTKPVTAETVSILQLIANPERYDGQRVQVIGFLRLEFEGNGIYLHREDYERGIAQNGLAVQLPSAMTKEQTDAVNMNYVICLGTFVASPRGHFGLWSGTIKDIERLQVWPGHSWNHQPSSGHEPASQ